MRFSVPAALLCLPFALAGCSLTSTAPSTADVGAPMQGRLMGGQQPVAGAHVYLFAANTTGYGGPGITGSASNASLSLLNSASTGLSDSIGAYVLSDAGGGFNITGDYSCTPGSQVYVYAVGGNPGSGANSAAGLLAALGNCPAGGNFSAVPFIFMDEVSTVAAAYSFAGFASDATHVSSSGTALAKVGIANAFATVTNLASLTTGQALAATPGGNGTVPQATINTLANILASCLNSTGPSSTSCTTLFTNAESGGTTGTAPTDTATAAINMAHNPAAGVAALYALSVSTPPFAPALSAQPNDFTIGLTFTNGMNAPNDTRIDAQGNVWIVNSGNSLCKLSPLGVPATGSPFTGNGLHSSDTVTIDLSGNAWVTDAYPPGVSEFDNSGNVVSGSPWSDSNGPSEIAIDSSGYVWIAEGTGVEKWTSSGVPVSGSPYTGGTGGGAVGIGIDGAGNVWESGSSRVQKLSSSGTYLSGATGYTGGGLNYAGYLAIDKSGNVWVANQNGQGITEFSNSGTALSPSTGYTGGGIYFPFAVAIDGAGNVWVADYGTASVGPNGTANVVELASDGSILSGSTGYKGGAFDKPESIAVDGSGNVWMAAIYQNTAVELVGAATPVITPIVAGLPSTPTSDGSSNLGTRP